MSIHAVPARSFVTAGRIAVPVLLVAGWAAAAALTPEVATVGASLSAVAGAWADGTLRPDVADTLQAVIAGFALSAVMGIPFGVWAARRTYTYQVVEPLFSSTAAVPRIVLLPIFLSLFGITVNAKIAIAVSAAIVPIVLTSMAGTRTVNPTLIKLGRSLEMSRWTLLRRVIVPAALASIMSGLRIGFSLALLAVILSEFVAATSGIGLRIQSAYSLQQLPLMYGLVVLVVLVGLAGNLGIWFLERRAAR
ncbi:ABC transporter permease [Nonomuraea lactucae]|uniref:ABC transporter permease n=1 Tax=Nonomuraea lactucae TaxID=2249762 RepID=UPI000DE2FEC0|nr:ABC transporter permease subunit [Nonomuraea lactucae]